MRRILNRVLYIRKDLYKRFIIIGIWRIVTLPAVPHTFLVRDIVVCINGRIVTSHVLTAWLLRKYCRELL